MNKTKSMQEIVQKAAEKTRKYMADNKADRQKLYECLYKDYIYLNDWTCYVMEQTEPVGTDKYHYELVFYPERLIPDIDIK